MKRLIILTFFMCLLSVPSAHAENAVSYFNRALSSSTAVNKIKNFSKALELNPKLSEAYARRGVLYYFQEKYDRVIQDFNHYVMLVPNDAEGYRMLGMGYLHKGDYDAAISTFTIAMKIDPKSTGAVCYRAEAYRLKGDYENAIFDAGTSIRMGGEPRMISDAFITRAKVYRALGEHQKSLKDIQSALNLDPRTYFYRNIVDYASMEGLQRAGLIVMVVIAFIFIFNLKLKAPQKDE